MTRSEGVLRRHVDNGTKSTEIRNDSRLPGHGLPCVGCLLRRTLHVEGQPHRWAGHQSWGTGDRPRWANNDSKYTGLKNKTPRPGPAHNRTAKSQKGRTARNPEVHSKTAAE